MSDSSLTFIGRYELFYMCIIKMDTWRIWQIPMKMDHRIHMADLKAQNEISPDNSADQIINQVLHFSIFSTLMSLEI